MSGHTPSTEQMREAWSEMSGWDMSLDESDAAFNRFLATVRADHEKAVRERIAQDIVAQADGEVDIFLAGMIEAARIVKEGA